MESAPVGKSGAMRARFWLGLVVVATIALGSTVLALVVHERERDNFESAQRSEAIRSARQAEALAALSVGQLGGAAAFYQAEGEGGLSEREFDVIADSLLEGGALAATGFIASVPTGERDEFERERGLPVVERNALGALRPAGERDHYYPLSFAAAVGAMTTMPLGYDIGVDARRGSYLLRARDRGRPAATPVIRLPVGGTGINVFRPVYRDGAPTATVGQRRAALVGFAVGAFRVPDLVGAATAALPAEFDAALVEDGRVVAGEEVPREGAEGVPIRIGDRSWLLVVRSSDRPGLGLPGLIAVVGLSLAALLAALVLIWSRNERMQELRRQANQDSLTGLKNRRRFEEDLRTELARSHRYGTPGALMMIDLDRFKRVNDTLGHQAGDRVIAEIAATIHGRTRETDVLARLGGDEFAVVLPSCDVDEARAVAAEIATAIGERSGSDDAPPVTASIGVTPFGAGQRLSYETLLARADAAMYEAKRAGRGTVRVGA